MLDVHQIHITCGCSCVVCVTSSAAAAQQHHFCSGGSSRSYIAMAPTDAAAAYEIKSNIHSCSCQHSHTERRHIDVNDNDNVLNLSLCSTQFVTTLDHLMTDGSMNVSPSLHSDHTFHC